MYRLMYLIILMKYLIRAPFNKGAKRSVSILSTATETIATRRVTYSELFYTSVSLTFHFENTRISNLKFSSRIFQQMKSRDE